METSVECVKGFSFPDYITKACQITHELDSFTDVTLIAGNKHISAHKIILSASSQFFQTLLNEVPQEIHPSVILNSIDYEDLEVVIRFIYSGEVSIDSVRFNTVLEVAKCLQIKGLMEVKYIFNNTEDVSNNIAVEMTENIEEIDENYLGDETLKLLSMSNNANQQDYVTEQELTFELLEENPDILKSSSQEEKAVSDEGYKTQRTIKAARRKCLQSPRTVKSPNSAYTDCNLKAALEDIKKGAKLSDAANKHSIPKSTLYLHAKAKGAFISVTRTEHSEKNVQDAMKAVVEGLSLKQASDKFHIPKTVLWRRLRKKSDSSVSDILTQRKKLHDPVLKEKASAALQKGLGISTISKKYNIPIATVFRQKKYLIEQGKLDPTSIRKPKKHIVKKAVKAVLSGGSLHQAAATFNVSKTTVWRHLREMEKQQIEGQEHPYYIIVENEDSLLNDNI